MIEAIKSFSDEFGYHQIGAKLEGYSAERAKELEELGLVKPIETPKKKKSDK